MTKPGRNDDIESAVDIGRAVAKLDEAMMALPQMAHEFISAMLGWLENEFIAQRKAAEIATAQAAADRKALENEKAHVEAMRIVLLEASTHIAEFSTANDEEIQARITRVTE